MLLLNDQPPKTIPVVIRYVCDTQYVSGGRLPKRLKTTGAFPMYQDRSWLKCLSKASTATTLPTTSDATGFNSPADVTNEEMMLTEASLAVIEQLRLAGRGKRRVSVPSGSVVFE